MKCFEMEQSFLFSFLDNLSYCHYMTTRLPESEFPLWTIGWLYPYDSILQPIFDKYLLELSETGLFDKIMSTVIEKKQECLDDPVIEVDFRFVNVIFYLLITGVCLALIIFILESYGFDFLKKDLIWP